jgi:CRP/FNR family transcriptional regulator, cyclic AMP receptor protein
MDVRKVASLLGRVELFSALDERALHRLASRSFEQVVPKGHAVFVQDEPGDRMFVLVDGIVKLIVRSRQGDVVELVRHWAPAVFGEVALLDRGPRSATAEVVHTARLIVITRDQLVELLHSERAVVDALLRSLGMIVRRTTDQMTDLVFLDVQGRLARQLLRLVDPSQAPEPSGTRIRRVTQTELANMVGVARQTVNLALRSFEDRGYIRVLGWTIEIVDPERLRRRAEG